MMRGLPRGLALWAGAPGAGVLPSPASPALAQPPAATGAAALVPGGAGRKGAEAALDVIRGLLGR
jgi:hypothetical protein